MFPLICQYSTTVSIEKFTKFFLLMPNIFSLFSFFQQVVHGKNKRVLLQKGYLFKLILVNIDYD